MDDEIVEQVLSNNTDAETESTNGPDGNTAVSRQMMEVVARILLITGASVWTVIGNLNVWMMSRADVFTGIAAIVAMLLLLGVILRGYIPVLESREYIFLVIAVVSGSVLLISGLICYAVSIEFVPLTCLCNYTEGSLHPARYRSP